MTQKITLTIKAPPGTKKLPKPPLKYLVIAFTFSAASPALGFWEYGRSNDFGSLYFAGSMACTLLSMSIVGLFSWLKKDCRLEICRTANELQFQNRIKILSFSATISFVSTLLILNPKNASAVSLLWWIMMGITSIGWSLFIALAVISGACFCTVLSDRGIRIHVLFRSDRVILWDDCPEPYMIYPQIVALLVDDKVIYVSTGFEATDPRIMVALINYYRDHPEHRHELTTGETITRLTTGHLPIDWTITPQPQKQKNT